MIPCFINSANKICCQNSLKNQLTPYLNSNFTSKNQLTLPKSVISEFPGIEYFDVIKEKGRIVLTPVNIVQADTVRAKLAELGVTEADITEAIAWARQSK